MAPPITSASTLPIRFSSSSSLVETLAPPTMAMTGFFGASSALRQRFEFGLHGAAGIGRQLVAEPFGRGVRAVRRREGVVDPEVAELGERGDERRIVLLLALVEARVLQTENVAGLHRGDRGFGLLRRCNPRRRRRGASPRARRRRRSASATPSGPAPSGRPKCASRITLPPLSAISVMVGATRSMRVASVTLPFSIGTLRSTRSSTRLPFTSA